MSTVCGVGGTSVCGWMRMGVEGRWMTGASGGFIVKGNMDDGAMGVTIRRWNEAFDSASIIARSEEAATF